jgi:hypothetical protein
MSLRRIDLFSFALFLLVDSGWLLLILCLAFGNMSRGIARA